MNDRLHYLYPNRASSGHQVLYWMQASVRVRDNLALAVAQREARDRNLPLSILYCLDFNAEGENQRSLSLVLDGLEDVEASLRTLGLSLTVALASPLVAVTAAASDCALTVFDTSYLPTGRRQRGDIARGVDCPVIQAEDNVVVPADTASQKEEWSAATLRPKIMRLAAVQPFLPTCLAEVVPDGSELLRSWLEKRGIPVLSESPSRILLDQWKIDDRVLATPFQGGETQAWRRWEAFRDEKLESYDRDRNDPNLDGQSGLAPSLRLGHLSPLSIVEDLKSRNLWKEALSFRRAGEDPVSKFLDELVVRRELSVNFVRLNPDHASWRCLPAWAQNTLVAHAVDRREFTYSRDEWEAAKTHDVAWNAAQNQLVSTGILHGYMRMYWGKKILEWSPDPAQAYLDALYLNNKYALDGGDPNSYAGVAWCFGKHDRPWGERAVYGMVRCMTSGGLRKKFDLDAYLNRFTPPN